MTAGLLLAAFLFVLCAVVSEKNVLWIPVILLVAVAAANTTGALTALRF